MSREEGNPGSGLGTRRIWVAGGLAILLWAGLDPRFQAPDGGPAGILAFPLTLGLVALLVALMRRQLGRRATGWTTLALIGHAATLQLIDAGRTVHYQHYRPLSELLQLAPIPLGVVVLQTLIVTVALARNAGWARRLPSAIGGWRLVLLILALVLSSTTLGRDVPAYLTEMAVAPLIQLVQLANICLVALTLPATTLERFGAWTDRWLGPSDPVETSGAPAIDRFTVILALAAAAGSALLALTAYQRHPHIPDEVVYLLQARTFARGALTLPARPVPSAFDLYLMEDHPLGWYSVVPPGWGVVLLPGAWIGLEWLVNPALTGLCVILASLVLQQLFDRRTTRLAVALLAFSPWPLFLGMSYMSQSATLAAALAATLGVLRARRTGQDRWAWLGGLALGLVATIRQLDGMIMAALLGLWAIGLGGKRLRIGATAGLVIGSMLVAAGLLAYNRVFTGKASVFPIMRYNDLRYGPGSNAYGFGPDRGMGWPSDPGPGHNVRDAIINTNLNLTATQVELFGWAAGSLLLVYLFLLYGRFRQSDRLMLAVIGLTWLAYFFNYFSGGPDFGARYWYLMLVPLVALSARGLGALGDRLSAAGVADGSRRALAMATVATVSALIGFVPWRAMDKYWHFRGGRPDAAVLARKHGMTNALVLVCGREVPDYASAAWANPLDLRGPDPIFIRQAGDSSLAAARAAFPDRPLWIMAGPSVTGLGYSVKAGPIAPDSTAEGACD